MKSKIQIPQDVLNAIDYANTTNGGMSEPNLAISKGEDGYTVRVKVAGLGADSFQIEVVENRLWVYHLITLFAEQPEGLEVLKSVRTLGSLLLPNDVEAEAIAARYEGEARSLNISLPFSQSKRDFHRHIDVEKW